MAVVFAAWATSCGARQSLHPHAPSPSPPPLRARSPSAAELLNDPFIKKVAVKTTKLADGLLAEVPEVGTKDAAGRLGDDARPKGYAPVSLGGKGASWRSGGSGSRGDEVLGYRGTLARLLPSPWPPLTDEGALPPPHPSPRSQAPPSCRARRGSSPTT